MERGAGKKMRLIQTATSTQESTTTTKSTVKVNLSGRAAINITAITSLTRDMATVKCIGRTAQSIKETGSRACSMDSVKLQLRMERL